MDTALADLAQQTVEYALKRGAGEVAVRTGRARFIQVKRREFRTETLQASTSRGLSLALYVDGRYSSNGTSFLQLEQVLRFVDQTLAMTRRLAPDRYRYLPQPSLYGPTEGVELDLEDHTYDQLEMSRRHELVTEVEQAARGCSGPVISASAEIVTQASEALQIHSNGFCGESRSTSFMLGATVTVRGEGDRRPEDRWWTAARHLEDLPEAETIGREAGRRALARIGSRKVDSGRMALLVENRAAGRLIGALLEPLAGVSLQQHRSCFEGCLGEELASPLLTLEDQPLRRRGLGSRTFDGEGLKARALKVFTAGRLESYFVDVYYGRKLGIDPTTGSASNLLLVPGPHSREELVKRIDRGILVTGFLGGNSNPVTGDFSFGVSGLLIEHGSLGHAVSEMNITGSHTTLWRRLSAVGDDPYPYSRIRAPTLLFEDVQFSGT